ncbi:uncharacterized protein LOC130010503 [Patella vulgata]|uniref:uncharacterized protein LOC130010503 n=1 Tax=Patella vulgata TaxID=6465 RepID=UPI0024A86923|nr:uncharacterized protein LOC130010503 [Patella vulgata]
MSTDNKFKDTNDLYGKMNVDSPRLRVMKGEALTNLDDVKEKKYVKTRAFGEGLKILKSQHILGIIGAAGDGKTILSMMIANQFIEERPEYKPLLIYDMDDLKEVNFKDDKYLYIIDDMYGKFNKLQARIDKWPTHFRTLRINKERGNLFIIYVMRDYIYLSSEYQLDKYHLFGDNTEKTTRIFLHKSQFSLNNEEKRHLLDFYSVTSDQIISKISDCFGFPSIVSLCSNLTNDKIPEGFDSSHDFLILELETFWKENEDIYATLLLVFCLHEVSEQDLKQRSSKKVESLISTIIKEVCKEFKLKVAKCKVNELSYTFIKYIESNYVKIFSLRDFVEAPFLHHLSGKCMEMALQYCSFELLMALVRTNHQDDQCIIIRKCYYDDLSMRCIKELQDKNADIVSHPAFIDYTFLSHFLGMNGIANLLHDTKFINLGDIREIQESGNFLHYITLHGDMRCLKAVLVYFQDFLPHLVAEKTDMEWDIIGLATVSMHDSMEKINLLKEKKIGDLLALPHLAVYSDKFEIVKHISNFTNFDKSKRDTKSRTVLHNACDSKYDNSQIINFLIDTAFDVNAADDSGNTPLHLAVARGKPQTVSILISKGAEVNVADDVGRLPIHNFSSSLGGRTDVEVTDILNQLIQAGSLLHEADKLGRIPLQDIIANADRKCFELLINTVTSFDILDAEYIHTIILESTKLLDDSMFRSILSYVNEINISHLSDSILFMCCASVDKMRILHNKGMDFDVVDGNKCSVLHHSCQHGSIDTVRYLVNERELNINQKAKNGRTPIFCSAVSDIDPVKKLKFLLSKGCSLHVVDGLNRSLLHLSCRFGILQVVEYLINEVGLDVGHRDSEGYTPAAFCSISNITPVSKLKFLFSKGASLLTENNNNLSLLHVSCELGTIETVKYLVNEIGLDVNHKDIKGWTPAKDCCVSKNNSFSKLKFLYSKGADLSSVDNNNMSLLQCSCKEGTVEIVEYLVNEIRLDVRHKDNHGWTTAIFCSTSNMNPIEKLKFLSSKGVSLHATDNTNMSLLHFSSLVGTVETVEYLVKEIGMDVNHKDNNGKTPAFCCSCSNTGPVKKLKFLSSNGVNLHTMNLLHAACALGTIETVEYLVNDVGLDVNISYGDETPLLNCFDSDIQKMEKISFLILSGATIIICRPYYYKDYFQFEDDYSKCNYLLHHSCYLGILDTVKVLVNDAGYDVNYIGDDNMTALFWCFKTKIQQQEKIMFLISKGAKITICRPYKGLLQYSS